MPNIIDLTIPIEDHFRWAVHRETRGNFAEGDLFQVTHMKWAVHGFTHIDAPRHMVPGGATTSDLDLRTVTGRATVVDLTSFADSTSVEPTARPGQLALAPNTAVTPAMLAAAGSHIEAGDLVLLKSCWDKVASYKTPEFWTKAPYLTRGAAEWLLARGIKAIGYDFPQDYVIRLLLDGVMAPIEEHVTHDVLLRNGIIMIEYLQNMAALIEPYTNLYALPLKIPNADGAPARVIAVTS